MRNYRKTIGKLSTALQGCRSGELRKLQWSEAREAEIVVLAHKAKDREERRTPIMPAMAKIRERRKLGPDGQELAADRYVFGNEVGEIVARCRLCTWWSDTLTAAGAKDLHLHDLRAEAASQLSEAGASDTDARCTRPLEHVDEQRLLAFASNVAARRLCETRAQGVAIGPSEESMRFYALPTSRSVSWQPTAPPGARPVGRNDRETPIRSAWQCPVTPRCSALTM